MRLSACIRRPSCSPRTNKFLIDNFVPLYVDDINSAICCAYDTLYSCLVPRPFSVSIMYNAALQVYSKRQFRREFITREESILKTFGYKFPRSPWNSRVANRTLGSAKREIEASTSQISIRSKFHMHVILLSRSSYCVPTCIVSQVRWTDETWKSHCEAVGCATGE